MKRLYLLVLMVLLMGLSCQSNKKEKFWFNAGFEAAYEVYEKANEEGFEPPNILYIAMQAEIVGGSQEMRSMAKNTEELELLKQVYSYGFVAMSDFYYERAGKYLDQLQQCANDAAPYALAPAYLPEELKTRFNELQRLYFEEIKKFVNDLPAYKNAVREKKWKDYLTQRKFK